MPDVEAVRQMIQEHVPFVRVLEARIEEIEPERVVVAMPDSPTRLNHVGTVHAAAQFGLGETAAGTMVFVAFADLQQAGYVPLAASANITYRRPSRGALRGEAALPAAEQARIRDDIASQGRARFSIPVRLMDAEGVVTTEMQVDWALVAHRAPGA